MKDETRKMKKKMKDEREKLPKSEETSEVSFIRIP